MIMLLCQNFCRNHQGSLIAVVNGNKHTHQRYEGLSAAHIALQESIHVFAAAHVAPDFFDYPFLSVCELERKLVFVKTVKIVAHPGKNITRNAFFSPVSGFEHTKLDEKQFLEFESVFCLRQGFVTVRKV